VNIRTHKICKQTNITIRSLLIYNTSWYKPKFTVKSHFKEFQYLLYLGLESPKRAAVLVDTWGL